MAQGQKAEPSLSKGLMSGLIQSPFYPLSYVKVLIQVGHEPLPPFKSRTLFGKDQLYYPNSFSYLRYIYSIEGVTGLYRGLGMKLIGNAIGTAASDQISKMLEEVDRNTEAQLSKRIPDDNLRIFIKNTTRDMTAKCWGVIISHPFHVMAVRCMAQFVGGEMKYSSFNLYQNVVEIYQGEGFSGFFSGLVPRVLFEASTIAITNLLAYLIKNYVFEDKEVDTFIDLFSSLVASSLTYPLSVVSTISCVSGSSLVAARPPKMPLYSSWVDVLRHLSRSNQLKRGSSLFFRIYSPSASSLLI